MLRVFLVEDESIIRETLRDTVPWAQYGYSFAGEAGDGEMALPLIRQVKPDVLITDIRMPFMDGLALSELVSREFPEMKTVIISGYDDFEYARKAISIGVDRYLLKPITKRALLDVLEELKEKIEGERANRSYLAQFHQEAEEYEQYTRRVFFERVVAGQLSVQEIYESAAKLDIDLRAQCYSLAFFSVLPEPSASAEAYSEPGARLRDALLEHFLKYPEYILLHTLAESAQLIGFRTDWFPDRQVTADDVLCPAAQVHHWLGDRAAQPDAVTDQQQDQPPRTRPGPEGFPPQSAGRSAAVTGSAGPTRSKGSCTCTLESWR